MTKPNPYSPRKTPSQARSSATYNAILEASAQVLAIEGYAGTTTNKVAEKAGVSIGSLYEYFPTKEAIFAELIRKLDQSMAESVIENFSTMMTVEPAQFLETVLRTRIQAAIDSPELDTLLRAEIPPYLFEEQIQNTYNRFAQGMKIFANLNPNIIRIENLDTAIELGTSVVESTIRSFAAHNPERLKDEALVKEFVDMMLRYILKD